MKTVVKINHEKEYELAKNVVKSLSSSGDYNSEVSTLDGSIDNLKIVIDVLIDRLTPKKRIKPPQKTKKKNKKQKPRQDFDKLPSEKFPNLEVREEIVKNKEIPECPCCSREMKESGLYKSSEKLEIIPKQYYIICKKRVIYNCSNCNGSMVNASSQPSISRNSNYGDSVIIDASLSKYCDLIPMERYSAMASRDGVSGIPPNSLIGLTHTLAEFLKPIYTGIKKEVLNSKIILADETPHKMLEGDITANWYLWGFSSSKACFLEAHGTRSGDIPIKFLSESNADYLLTDGYSGYKRALKELLKEKAIKISEVYCNAHAVRYFKDASVNWENESKNILLFYGDIYSLEREASNSEEKKIAREKMLPLFEKIKSECEEPPADIIAKSSFEKAVNYFLNHYDGLVRCLENIDIPLDNNFSERLLRSPVIGRKTWYGTHSKRGARTNATLFSIVETCKINKVNPRKYFLWITEQIHLKKPILTPSQYATFTDSG